MLLKQFKRTGPLTIFLIIVILLLLWASAFVKLKGQFSWYFDLNSMPLYGLLSDLIGTNPLPGIIVTFLLVSLMAFLMVNLNTILFFIHERTFLPALIYILLSGLFPQYQLLNPAIIGAAFLMFAIRSIMDAYRVTGTAYNFFDAGILISTGSLFYANLIWFGPITIIGIALLRTWNLKEILLSFLGLVTPYILTLGIYYVLGNDISEILRIVEYNLFGKQADFVFLPLTVIAVSYTGFIILISISYLFALMNSKKIQARKTFYLLIWVGLISLCIYIILPSVSVEIIWITAIPAGYVLTHYFVFTRKKLLPEILFSVLFLVILITQIWYMR